MLDSRHAMRLAALLAISLAGAAQPRLEKKIPVNPNPYSAGEDARLLKLYQGLRVADVSDAMDIVGLRGTGLVSSEIKPLWRDLEDFSHRFQGIALTARYVRTNREVPSMTPEEFDKWQGEWYGGISPEAYVDLLRPGSALVFDASEDGDTGTIGSFNIMRWKLQGCRGVVTSGGARDTDEVMKEKVPIYLRRITRGYPPGRNELEAVNTPVMVGGVLVYPGDVVVADGDGVVVVPRRHAEDVARHARRILDNDKKARRALYEKLGLPPDKTVEPD